MSGQQQAVFIHQCDKFLNNFALCGLVKIDHDIAAEDHIIGFTKRPLLIQQVELVKVNQIAYRFFYPDQPLMLGSAFFKELAQTVILFYLATNRMLYKL